MADRELKDDHWQLLGRRSSHSSARWFLPVPATRRATAAPRRVAAFEQLEGLLVFGLSDEFTLRWPDANGGGDSSFTGCISCAMANEERSNCLLMRDGAVDPHNGDVCHGRNLIRSFPCKKAYDNPVERASTDNLGTPFL
jgi:hypothetical protein